MSNTIKFFFVREVKRDDSMRIWEIRDHPKVRQNSNNQEKILFEKHDQWFKNKYFKNSNNFCFVLEKDNKVIGYCRFDFDLNYIISIAVDVNYYGKGFGHLLLSRSLEKFAENKNILAEIQKDNISSIRLFQKNNFQVYREDNKNYYLKYEQKSKTN